MKTGGLREPNQKETRKDGGAEKGQGKQGEGEVEKWAGEWETKEKWKEKWEEEEKGKGRKEKRKKGRKRKREEKEKRG